MRPRDWTKLAEAAYRLAMVIADKSKLMTRADRREAYNDARNIFEICDEQDARYSGRRKEKNLKDNRKLPSFDKADSSPEERQQPHTPNVRRVDRVKKGRKIVEEEVSSEFDPTQLEIEDN